MSVSNEKVFEDRLLRVTEVANILAVSRALVYKWINEGKIAYVSLPSGTIRIPYSEVRRILEKRRIGRGVDDNKN